MENFYYKKKIIIKKPFKMSIYLQIFFIVQLNAKHLERWIKNLQAMRGNRITMAFQYRNISPGQSMNDRMLLCF